MVNCPKCDAVLDVEEEDLDPGDALSCDECGATLSVKSTTPLEIAAAGDSDDEEEEDEDFDEDYDEDKDEEEEEEEEEEWE